MLSGKKRIAELEAELEKSNKALTELQNLNELINRNVARMATIMDINVRGNTNVFTCQRNGQVFTIETFHQMSDNVALWKSNAGIE